MDFCRKSSGFADFENTQWIEDQLCILARIPDCAFLDVWNEIWTIDPYTVEPPVSDHPKCQAWVVAYESLDHNGSKLFLIRIWKLPRLNSCTSADAMFYSYKGQFPEKNPDLPIMDSRRLLSMFLLRNFHFLN